MVAYDNSLTGRCLSPEGRLYGRGLIMRGSPGRVWFRPKQDRECCQHAFLKHLVVESNPLYFIQVRVILIPCGELPLLHGCLGRGSILLNRSVADNPRDCDPPQARFSPRFAVDSPGCHIYICCTQLHKPIRILRPITKYISDTA